MKKKILQISANKTPIFCGIGDYTSILSTVLAQKTEFIESTTHIANDDFRIKRLKGIRILFLILKKTLEESFDIVHLQYEPFGYFQSFLLPLFLGTFFRKKLVVTFHEVFYKNRIHFYRDKFLAEAAQTVITTDNSRFRALSNAIPSIADRLHIVGVGSNILPTDKEINTNQNVIGYFGFINAVKKIDIVLGVLRFLKSNIPDTKLRIIGDIDKKDGELQKILGWLEQERLTDSVEWILSQPNNVVSEKISECALLILPFSDGASPRRGSLQACLAHGKAVLTTFPENKEELIGLDFCDLHSQDSWNEKALRVLTDLDFRKSLEEKSAIVGQNYSWDRIVDAQIKIYQKV